MVSVVSGDGRRGDGEMECDWAEMTESLTVTRCPRGPAAPQPEFREKQSLTPSH